MQRRFNVTGACIPEMHYMVNLDGRLAEIKALIDNGEYFTINRARQYGKTTVLRRLNQYLKSDYYVVLMDFQTFGAEEFTNENTFALAFAEEFLQILKQTGFSELEEMKEAIKDLEDCIKYAPNNFRLRKLFLKLNYICFTFDKPIVLMIDEVDSASNNQVFLDFLAQFRAYYLNRDVRPTFQSVILAGVYDIKNLKRKLRSEEQHKTNSPWNIAADFNVDMSFSVADISTMLNEYEQDNVTGMNIKEVSKMIYDNTSGYPYLVSRICKIVDEYFIKNSQMDKSVAWTKAGILEAVKILLSEKNTLFESLINKINDYPELREVLYSLLFIGRQMVYNPDHEAIHIATMFGFIKNKNGTVVIANRIFETRLYNLFLTTSKMQSTDMYKMALQDKNQFIQHGHLNMELVLEKFVQHFHDIYGDRNATFLEEDGRRFFLLFLRPIINGTGNYYIEAETRNMERTDVIVDYKGEQFIIELKIWHGKSYHERGEKQLMEYLDYYHIDKGYMLSFNFNKNKHIGVNKIHLGEKVIIEAIV